MKSIFQGAILALAALSVSAAPMETYSSADNNDHSSDLQASRGRRSVTKSDDRHGAPTFFGDNPTADKNLPLRGDPKEASSSSTEAGITSSPYGNATTSSAPALSTSTSTYEKLSKRGRRSVTRSDDRHGAPTFFGDNPTADENLPLRGDPKEASPSSTQVGITSSPYGNATTSSAPALSTSASTYEKLSKRTRAPSRIVTPNVNNYVAKDNTLMFGMQNPVCSDVTLIFARGTTEVGNMGTCVGPELAEALRDEIPSLSVQGVDYPANSEGNTKYGASGGPYMAMLAREARKQCPDTKIVLAGYSQGARCIHGALEKSKKPFDGADVAAVVAFGDPLNGENAFKDVDDESVLQVCGDSDDRCQKGNVGMWVHGGHVSYGSSAKNVAKWIKKTVG